jgi:hypothetical protein
MSKLIIGFCGRAGAGKDTAAQLLQDLWWPEFAEFGAASARVTRVALADPMRDMLRALGIPAEYLSDRALKEAPIPGLDRSYRQLAQTLGTEWGRNCNGEDFWLKVAGLKIRNAKGLVMITDVRFPNEADWLRAQGGYLVRIDRPGVAAVNPHPSEQYADSLRVDYVLDNSGSIAKLRAQLGVMLEHLDEIPR